MRLLSTSEFAARISSPYTDSEPARCELLLAGKPTGVIVTGAVLEASVAWRDYRVAFFTNDIPFEEVLRIYLLDANMALLDTAMLGAMYSTGTFAELKLHAPDALTFRFFGGVLWRMVLLKQPEFAFPFLSDPSGVSRDFKFFRHFRIEESPLPERAASAADQTLPSRSITRMRDTPRGCAQWASPLLAKNRSPARNVTLSSWPSWR